MQVGMRVMAKPGVLERSVTLAQYRNQVGVVVQVHGSDRSVIVKYDDGREIAFERSEVRLWWAWK